MLISFIGMCCRFLVFLIKTTHTCKIIGGMGMCCKLVMGNPPKWPGETGPSDDNSQLDPISFPSYC